MGKLEERLQRVISELSESAPAGMNRLDTWAELLARRIVSTILNDVQKNVEIMLPQGGSPAEVKYAREALFRSVLTLFLERIHRK